MIFAGYMGSCSEWFIEHGDKFLTIAVSHSLTLSWFVPLAHKRGMSILGAISALSLLWGKSAGPLNPVFLHFAIHECNLHSIHASILGEWHPDFKQTLTNWIDMGPAGDLMPFQSHFATFHDTQVSYQSLKNILLTRCYDNNLRLCVCTIEINNLTMPLQVKCCTMPLLV